MLRNLLTAAVLAGVAAGLAAAALQFWLVVPSLLEGELFESGARVHFAVDGSPESIRGAPPFDGDWARHGLTLAFNLVTYTGFGLILAGLMMLARGRGARLDARAGLIWGLAGFVAVQMAPAIGMPPELPGTFAGEVGPRQAWWAGTILATGIGIWLIAFGRGLAVVGGVALLVVPHIVGAPHLDRYYGVAPPELAAQFATLSLGAALAGWAVLGTMTGWLLARGEAA